MYGKQALSKPPYSSTARRLIQARKFPDASAYLRSLIGQMVYACAGTFFGIIRKAQREGRRIIVTVESSDGRDVDVWADECSRDENAAKMMRMAAAIPRVGRINFHEGLENK
jgi:hypothetical protein